MADKRKKENTRNKILNSARDIFARKGYDGTSVDEIASGASVSKALLYYYYDSKETILLELMKRSIENTIKELAERKSRGETPADTRQLLESGTELIKKEEDVMRIALSEALKSESNCDLICELPIAIFEEYNAIFHFSNRERLLLILFAAKLITFSTIKGKISRLLSIDEHELEKIFSENIEPIFSEITEKSND